jgi:T5SS/PEP-CTERM-associated repeat protein
LNFESQLSIDPIGTYSPFGTSLSVGSGRLLHTKQLFVGETGTGVMTVNGGLVFIDGRFHVGDSSGGNGTLNITSGFVNVDSPSFSHHIYVGWDTGSTGVINIDGGNLISADRMTVGADGVGTINITGGGRLSTDPDPLYTSDVDYIGLLGTNPTGSGSVTIDGAGSRWDHSSSSARLIIGAGETGVLTVSNGGTVYFDGVLVNGLGTLRGNSSVHATVTNYGIVAPGVSLGVLEITGDYTQDPAGKLQIELGGTANGTEYDRLSISGSTSLGGTLQVTLTGGFTPAENDSFDIMDFIGYPGTFNTLSLPALPGSLQWDTSKLFTDGVISVVLPGDFNANHFVDAPDYVTWRKGLGTSYTQNDYNTWRAHFSQTASSSGPTIDSTTQAAVPEPTSLILIGSCLFSWLAVGQRRTISSIHKRCKAQNPRRARGDALRL